MQTAETPRLCDAPPITVRPRYDHDSSVALLTPDEFRSRYSGRNHADVSREILSETGATIIGVWHVYPGLDGEQRVSATLNGDWLRFGGASRSDHDYVVFFVPTPRGRLNVVHGVGVA